MTDVRFSALDLAKVPAPDVVEALDYETILAALKADFVTRWPAYNVQMLESDPAVKLMEVAAYREMLLRARVNDAARAVMLATALGSDLDHLGGLFGVTRAVITPPDPNALNPTAATLEDDERFRVRIQLALEAFSTAGPEGAYRFHAMTADPHVADLTLLQPKPGRVDVVLMSDQGTGEASAQMCQTVLSALNDRVIRPLTDMVTVRSVKITHYRVSLTCFIGRGPDPNVIRAQVLAKLDTHIADRRGVGLNVYRAGLIEAAMIPGVQNVVISAPTGDVDPGDDGLANCTSVTVKVQSL